MKLLSSRNLFQTYTKVICKTLFSVGCDLNDEILNTVLNYIVIIITINILQGDPLLMTLTNDEIFILGVLKLGERMGIRCAE